MKPGTPAKLCMLSFWLVVIGAMIARIGVETYLFYAGGAFTLLCFRWIIKHWDDLGY